MALAVGNNAPDFKLDGSDGKRHSLREFTGKYLVLYFYPKDETPGCTVEATNFGKAADAMSDKGAVVVGVSRDSVASHKAFIKHLNLNFLLLSDPDANTIKAYDTYDRSLISLGLHGTRTLRNTFLIDRSGKIIKMYKKVRPYVHAKEILEFLEYAK
ncbi:Peroxiredoxin [uncultured archaeon]|nr:Peroxiredoxin [uncultured archaeon]